MRGKFITAVTAAVRLPLSLTAALLLILVAAYPAAAAGDVLDQSQTRITAGATP